MQPEVFSPNAMPIYAYKCESCGFAKDVLQKMSDPPLETCPTCEKPSFKKQLTSAGFQLKGSGWYATDFKGSATASPAAQAGEADAKASVSEPAAGQPPPSKAEGATTVAPAAVVPPSP